jgi:AcrR family transcriptional regulator
MSSREGHDAAVPDESAPAEPVRRPRGRPRDEGADGRIIQAAADLMLERGIAEVTVDEVADQAGVGKATVYRRYPSKDALAAAALKMMFGRQVAVPDTGSFREDMIIVYSDTIRFAGSKKGSAFLRLAAGAATRSRKAADLYRDAYEQRRDQFGVIIDRALERGELTEDLNRALFLDSLPALLVWRVITNQPLPPLDQVPDLIDGIIRSLDEARDAALG